MTQFAVQAMPWSEPMMQTKATRSAATVEGCQEKLTGCYEMIEMLVHDLRNPVNAIQVASGFIEMNLPETILEENQNYVRLIQESCAQLSRMIHSMLEVSRMEASACLLFTSETQVSDLVQKALHQVSLLIAPTQSLKLDLADDLPELQVDCEMIVRVLVNLLENAIRFSPSRGEILVAAEQIETLNGPSIALSVSDQGPGVPPEARAQIFERFSQARESYTARRGYGLGLAYCRLAVKAHGGRIWVEPGPDGTGSRFIFILPLCPNG